MKFNENINICVEVNYSNFAAFLTVHIIVTRRQAQAIYNCRTRAFYRDAYSRHWMKVQIHLF